MNHKNAITKFTNVRTFPFTKKQLAALREEINEAGNFFDLMVKKKALKGKMGMKYITLLYNSQNYKQEQLTGVYEPLRSFYDTDMPFIFWNLMYQTLLRVEAKKA